MLALYSWYWDEDWPRRTISDEQEAIKYDFVICSICWFSVVGAGVAFFSERRGNKDLFTAPAGLCRLRGCLYFAVATKETAVSVLFD